MRGMNNMQANICLLAVTLCWSAEVVILSHLPEEVNPFATTCVTSLIAALLIGACFRRRISESLKRDGWKLVRRVLLLSVLSSAYNVLAEEGYDYFSVSAGAFTLTMTVVVLPVMLLVMRRGIDKRTWASSLCVLVGIIVALYPSFEHAQAMGIVLMVASCVFRAFFIVKLNDFARDHDPVSLSAGMTMFNAVITFIPWCAMEPMTFADLPWSPRLIAVYFVFSYFVVAFATMINVFAQRRATAVHSTIIYSLEIVFSIIWATCLPGTLVERVELTPAIVVGCALVVLGNLVKIMPFSRDEEDSDELDAATALDKAKASIAQTADLVTVLLSRLRSAVARNIALFIMLLAAYLVISLPFKVLSIIPGFTDARPVTMLMPVYGIFFGLPGCFAFAVGNLISDIASDSLRWSSIAGFIGNFANPFLMYLFWTQLRKKPFSLRKKRVVAGFILSIVVCGLIQSLIISPAVSLLYPEVDIMLFAITVVANTTLFPIGFAIPFIILIQEELDFVPMGRGKAFMESG